MSIAREAHPSGGLSFKDTAMVRIERNLAMTPEADQFLAGLSSTTGLKEGEVLRLALGMFKLAIDAKEQGKHVGVANTSDALEIEFVGFWGSMSDGTLEAD